MARESGWDRTITVFSPDGRLYQIGTCHLLQLPRTPPRPPSPLTPSPHPTPPPTHAEYAFKAVKAEGLTSVSVRGDDCVVFLAQKRVPDKLIDPSSVTHLFSITDGIGCVATGLLPDAKAMVRKAREMAGEFEFDNGYPIPVSYLAKRLADDNQVFTQHAYKRTAAVVLMLGAVDDEKGPQLYRVDPAGHYLGYRVRCRLPLFVAIGYPHSRTPTRAPTQSTTQASAAGSKEQDAINFLEKKVKVGTALPTEEAVRLAIATMQSILSSDFKAAEIEVSVARAGERVAVLSEADIDAHLTVLAERD